MPLVPAVTELVVAELLFCNYEQSDRPVYVYINSPGSQNDEGEVVGMDTEAGLSQSRQYLLPHQ
jgi:ATP-dependent Clp protease protease subunit